MEQVKVFCKEKASEVEKEANDWLSEHGEKISVVDRKFNCAIAANRYGSYYAYSIAIFYTNKH